MSPVPRQEQALCVFSNSGCNQASCITLIYLYLIFSTSSYQLFSWLCACLGWQVIYRYPENHAAPLSDSEIGALCFPHAVAPEKLRRTPSLSALDEVVLGRHVYGDEQCFVFLLKVCVIH